MTFVQGLLSYYSIICVNSESFSHLLLYYSVTLHLCCRLFRVMNVCTSTIFFPSIAKYISRYFPLNNFSSTLECELFKAFAVHFENWVPIIIFSFIVFRKYCKLSKAARSWFHLPSSSNQFYFYRIWREGKPRCIVGRLTHLFFGYFILLVLWIP